MKHAGENQSKSLGEARVVLLEDLGGAGCGGDGVGPPEEGPADGVYDRRSN